MEINKPRATQSSRKGKKSWRKNIDIDDIEIGLHENREKKRLLGDDFNEDFIIDTKGDDLLKSKATKVPKSKEILANKSKIPGLVTERNKKKIQGVEKSEIHRLMKLSGKVQGESKLKTRIEKDGIINVENKDIWSEDIVNDTPEVLTNSSDKAITKPKTIPKTLKQSPIRISDFEKIIDAGKSYNPSLESWKKLINKEFSTEYEREVKRKELEDYKDRIRQLISNLDENENLSDSSDEGESEGDEEQPSDHKLSVNKPTQVRIKTKSKRNKELRHKQRLELQGKLKQLKQQINELSKLDEINKEVNNKLERQPKKKTKVPKKLFKYDSIQKPLEVKLSDELTNNLKNLKPEGNLFYDQMINLQSSGKIETRIPVAKRRKYTPKITEKWTYKDFK